MRAEMGYVSEGAAGLSFSEYDCEKRETSQNRDSCSTDTSQADTTQTYPTKKTKTNKLKDDKARSSQHGDVDASRHKSTGSVKKVMDDGEKKTRNMTDDRSKRQINFNRGMHVHCKQKTTTTKYI